VTPWRRTLGEEWLTTERETAGLDPDAEVWLDVHAFHEHLTACQAHGHAVSQACPDCLPTLTEAVALYQDDLFAGFTLRDSAQFDEWQRFQTQGLRDELAGALERLANAYGNQKEYERAIPHARRWLSLDPLHEPAHRFLMRLYAYSGLHTAALRQYRQCVRLLEGELDALPSEETTALYQRIRAEWSLRAEETAPPAATPAPSPPVPPSFLRERAEPVGAAEHVFVAREHELAQVDRFLDAALAGKGGVVFVTGGAGRGKTALMAEFARRATDAHPELLVATGDCNAYSGIGDPYLPFREVLGTLTGDVEARWAAGAITREQARRLWGALPLAIQALLAHGPALIDTLLPGPALYSRAEAAALPQDGTRSAGGAGWLRRLRERIERERVEPGDLAQSQLFEQVTEVLRAVAARRPLLLFLDDVHWADAASISLLFHLGRRLEESRILVVCAYRPDEVAVGRSGERHPLQKVLAELKRRFGDVWVDLAQTDESEERRFVEAFLQTEPNRLGGGFRDALFRHTGGHPLFTVELLRAMQARGELIQDEDGRWVEGAVLNWDRLPARVEAVIEERVGRLEEELREVLAVASVEGETFTAQVVARLQGVRERELLRALSQELAARHGLVQELGEVRVDGHFLSRYRFAHALSQRYLYNGLGAGERRLLHGEVAEALEALYGGQSETIVARLARHYAQAGQADKAVKYLSRAGDQARLAYAHEEAVAHYRRALAFLEEQGEHERAARTLMKLGLTYHTAFDFRRARQAYEEGFALWQRAAEAQWEDLPPAPHPLRLPTDQPTTLDPTMAGDVQSDSKINQLFSGLVDPSPDLGVVPDVAQSWDVLEGGKKYLFYLRDDVRWSDGNPVTAGDFEYGWKRVLDPATWSPLANLLYDVKGARAFHQGQVSDPDSVGVKALDEVTLAVELEGPTGYFLHLLTGCTTFPVPRHAVELHGEAWAEPENIVTCGPFRLQAWQPGERMTLVRNPDYHGRFTGNLERVELLLRDVEPAARLEMYEGDRLDVVWITSSEVDRVRQRYAGEYRSVPILRTMYLQFDASRPPFDDVRVRRAFVLAADREVLVKAVAPDFFPATGGFVPPGMPGHSPGIGLPYDPGQARQLLAEAGYPGGQGFPVVECLVWTAWVDPGENLQAQWRENLGVKIEWETMEWRALLARLDERVPHLLITGWDADYPDPDNFMRVGYDQHKSGWRNEGYGSLVERAQRSLDQGERMRMYGEAERILAEEAPIMPIYYFSSRLLVKPWVTGYPATGMRGWFWKDVIIKPHE
jgi:ABC-type oligopeptide transport system substrate-binding subunit/DNA-binding SARP family transcriptional activator